MHSGYEMNWYSRRTLQLFGVALATLFYNEFLLYYITLKQCDWPELSSPKSNVVKSMIIADTHLLGPNGHWWDRLRREWQMQRTFQTSLQMLQPDVIFMLGDLFDEGKWTVDSDFQKDVARFKKMFRHSPSVKLFSVIGNHDVGFHYMINQHKLRRFVEAVNSSDSVSLIQYQGISFVTVNSMAFEGDGCTMCHKAVEDLKALSFKLKCAQNNWPKECSKIKEHFQYTQPILLQHFPLFRTSDSHCVGPDSTPEAEKNDKFRPRYDCLSKEASHQLLDAIKPRLVISGHTHYFCKTLHDSGLVEWNVPSFSWRNHKGPSFFMARITSDDYAINKCFIPNENTVYLVYGTVIAGIILYVLLCCCRLAKWRITSNMTHKLKQ